MNAPTIFLKGGESDSGRLVAEVLHRIRFEKSAERIRIGAGHYGRGKIRNIRLIEGDTGGAVLETFFRRHQGDAVSRLWVERDLFGELTITRATCNCGCQACIHRIAGAVAVARSVDLDALNSFRVEERTTAIRLVLTGAAIEGLKEGIFEKGIDVARHRAGVIEVLDASDESALKPYLEKGDIETATGAKHDLLVDLDRLGCVPLRHLRGVKIDRIKAPHRFALSTKTMEPTEAARKVQNLIEEFEGLQATAALRKLCENRGWSFNLDQGWPFRVNFDPAPMKLALDRTKEGMLSATGLIMVADEELELAEQIAPLVAKILKLFPDAFVSDDEEADEAARALIRESIPWIKGTDGQWSQPDPEAFAAMVAMFVALDSMGGTIHPAAVGRLRDRLDELEIEQVEIEGERDLLKIVQAIGALRDPLPHPTPEGCKAKLEDHQQIGLAWLKIIADHELGGLLADEAGTGKTLQCLSLLHLRKRDGLGSRPSLVVGPVAIMEPWLSQAETFYDDLKGVSHHGDARKPLADLLAARPDFVVTTFSLLRLEIEQFAAVDWDVVFVDEAQNAKNNTADIGLAIRRLSARARISITGSPVENSLHDLWSHLDFCVPGLFGDRREFHKRFRRPIEHAFDDEESQALAKRAHAQLRAIIKPFVLRRLESDTKIALPPLTIEQVPITMSRAEQTLYDAIRLRTERRVRDAIKNQGIARSGAENKLNMLSTLRQLCCDARMIRMPEGKTPPKSSKLKTILQLLKSLIKDGHKVLVFAEYVQFLKHLEDEIEALGIPYLYLDGRTKAHERAADTRAFQSGEYDVYLLSKTAANFAITLTASDRVIMADHSWNPMVDLQAFKRSHRKGQTKPVTVYRMICKGTIEEKTIRIQERKIGIADIVGDLSLENTDNLSDSDIIELLSAD